MERTTEVLKRVNKSTVRLTVGDITLLDVDAFVFYASHDLKLGTGYGTAISGRGGPSIQKELEGLGPLATCEVVVTGAGELRAKHIVHAVGPRFQEEDTNGKLARTVRKCLETADERGLRTLAMPAMGAGFYGVPLADCARVMVETIFEHLEGETGIAEVILCVLDSREYAAFEWELGRRSDGGRGN